MFIFDALLRMGTQKGVFVTSERQIDANMAISRAGFAYGKQLGYPL